MVALSALGAFGCVALAPPAPAPRSAFGWTPSERRRPGGPPRDALSLRGVLRDRPMGAWNRSLPRGIPWQVVPRSIRRALAGVRRPLRPLEREALAGYGGVAPSRRKRHESQGQSENGQQAANSSAVTLHGANIGQSPRGGQSA